MTGKNPSSFLHYFLPPPPPHFFWLPSFHPSILPSSLHPSHLYSLPLFNSLLAFLHSFLLFFPCFSSLFFFLLFLFFLFIYIFFYTFPFSYHFYFAYHPVIFLPICIVFFNIEYLRQNTLMEPRRFSMTPDVIIYLSIVEAVQL